MIILKKILALIMMIALLMTSTGAAIAVDNTVKVYVDGVEIQFPDQKAILNSDNRTMVPVRFVSQALGADVDWNEETKQVNVKHKGQDITLTIGQMLAKVNAGQVTLDTTASILSSRAMVPLRFVSECLKATVEWKKAERAVYITTSDSDQALVDSDLIVNPHYPDSKPSDLSAIILYEYKTPVEPQIRDLKELLEKRFGSKAQKIVDYVAVKKDAYNRILDKDWVIDGKNVNVTDNGATVTVSVWG